MKKIRPAIEELQPVLAVKKRLVIYMFIGRLSGKCRPTQRGGFVTAHNGISRFLKI